MPRIKKEVTNSEEVVATPETSAVETKKSSKIVITASFKTRTVDGDRISHKYSGEGASVAEALNDVKGSDDELVDEYGRPFPTKVNLLVDVVVKRGDYRFDRAIAPHNSEEIFTNKNVALVNKLFGL